MGNYSARFGGGHLEKDRKAPRQVSTLQLYPIIYILYLTVFKGVCRRRACSKKQALLLHTPCYFPAPGCIPRSESGSPASSAGLSPTAESAVTASSGWGLRSRRIW